MVLDSIEAKYREQKALADAAMAQLSVAQLSEPGPGRSNSISVIAWHLGGNLASRFTDFLTSDGEKPWRDRESEFAPRAPGRRDLAEHWDRGWNVLFESLGGLSDADLARSVTIRGVSLTVVEALHRSLAHAAYHVGQIVYVAKALRGAEWRYLSIPPGKSAEYLRNPTAERASENAARLAALGKESDGDAPRASEPAPPK